MIIYDIVVSNNRNISSPSIERKVVEPGDPDYKDIVLQRNLNVNQYKVGERVKVRRGHDRGHVEAIQYDKNQIGWHRNRPLFIQVKFDSGKVVMVHPSQIKRSK